MPDATDALTVVAHEAGPFGGMESQLAALIAGLLDRGVEVRVIARRAQLEPHELLTVYELPGPARPFPLAYLWFFAVGTIAVARRRRGKVYAMGAIVLNRIDAAKVPFCHAAWASDPGRSSRAAGGGLSRRVNAAISGWLSRRAERFVYRPSRCGTLVAMSEAGVRELDEFFPRMRPARLIPNAVDTERFAPDDSARRAVREEHWIDADDLLAAFVGGDWRRKGLPQVIAALAERPRWKLIVAGRGEIDAMRGLATRAGVRDRVIFAGRVDDPECILAASDALVMPSRYEPFGNAVLEASACRLPVVVAPAHGVRDFVDPGSSGLFVEPSSHEIAAALARLEDPGLRAQFGRRGREIAESYSIDHVVNAYEDLLFGTREARAAVTPSSSQIRAETA